MKKVLSIIFSLFLFVGVLSGCSSNNGDGGADGDIVTLKWVTVGSGMPTNYDQWKEEVNKYLEEKIGVHIEMEVVSWGDWESRRNVIVNTNEDYDILFTNVGTYTNDVALGAFADITELVESESPDLYASIPSDYWDAVKVNGKIYSVPTYKDSSVTQYFIYDKSIVDKYSIDVDSVDELSDLTEPLKKVKEGENINPFILSNTGYLLYGMNYDQIGSGLPALGVRFDDESRKVVNIFEEEEVLKELNTLHQWYKEGIINADAPTLVENPSYKAVSVAQGWSSAAKTVWGPQLGVEAIAVQYGETIVSNDTVRGSLNAISASSEHPEEALKFLQLLNMDTKLRDAFYFGLEGDNFEYVDGKVKKLNTDWPMAGYTQASFFTVSQTVEEEFNQWDEVKELNENAKGSVLLGFTFDTEPVADELANCIEIYNRYRSEVNTGAKDPAVIVKAMVEEMNKAGMQKIIDEAQAQIDEAF
ncbi:ABC transporter substrate-binding protein [Alloiococcus sp. CFN-8]|uniref:ABC transporter substrate-binding protein n=1 Tax=Alloiococcus sp. CFN-8 TaxID=3416081 RepID=UPI003CE97C23